MRTAVLTAALLLFLYALPTKATPTRCEFIAVELFEAVDRGDITHQDALDILERCNKSRLIDSM